MPRWIRHDICVAYAALEYDWGVGGSLRERFRPNRRPESVGFQLHRMGVKLDRDEGAGWSSLLHYGDLNQMDIYVHALVRLGLSGLLLGDENDALVQFIRTEHADLLHHFPYLLSAQQWSQHDSH